MSDTPTEWAIDVQNVKKTYRGGTKALRGVDLRVAKGEVFGLLGPNGSGKSTLVKIMMTVIRRSAGKGSVLGEPIAHKPTLRKIGYLPEHHRFPGYLKGKQVLEYVGGLQGMDRTTKKKRAAELLDAVKMTDWAKTPVKRYSKGMRQRLGIAQALINDPDLVMLDEPTDGVDPVGRRDIRDLCKRMVDEGRTVFLNSHLLSELEMVCSRVAIMVQGEVRSQGTINELVQGQERYEIVIAADPARAAEFLLSALPPGAERPEGAGRGTLPSGEWVEISGTTLKIGSTQPETIAPVLDNLRRGGVLIHTVRPMRPSLEDLFMQAVTDPTTGEALMPGAAGKKKKRTKAPRAGGDA
ncbi:MAG: ABC transporter ATP-binding protein [Planctomycetota bacterium]